MSETIASWLATYLLHSTILLGCALIISLLVRSDAWREALLKTALIGALITSLVPLRFEAAPTAVQMHLGPVPPGARIEAVNPPTTAPPADDAAPAVVDTPAEPRVRPMQWMVIAVLSWIVIAAALLARLLVHNMRLLKRLRDRVQLSEGALPALVAELRRKAGFWVPVRVSVSHACATPIALGRREICLPLRFESDLDAEQQRAALAHELAHLRRRDPLWQVIAGVIESVFFFQPLNRVARLRLRAAAEHLADDWAVTQSGSSLSLARCLGNIASWVGEPVPAGTVAIAEGGSPLVERVERLANWRAPRRVLPLARALVAFALVLLVAGAAPRVNKERVGRSVTSFTAYPQARRSDAQPRRTPQARPTVIRQADAATPFAERFARAAQQGAANGFWIAWATSPPKGLKQYMSSGPAEDNEIEQPVVVETLLAPDRIGRDLVIVLGYASKSPKGEDPAWMRIRAATDSLNLRKLPLIWIGNATSDESITLLRRIYPTAQNAVVRSEIAAAYTMHRDFEPMIAAVHELLRNEKSATVRAEAVQWLPRTHAGERRLVSLLGDIVIPRDSDEGVRAEAVDALAWLMQNNTPGAREALVRIAETHSDWELRSEAAQALARHNRLKQ